MSGKLLKTVFGAASAFAGISYLTFYEVMGRDAKGMDFASKIFNKKSEGNGPKLPDEKTDDRIIWFKQQKFEEYKLLNSRNQTLRGYLLKADKPSNVYVFCSHGYRCNGKREFRFMSKYYHDKGYNLFYVDHQSAGLSEGKYIGFGYYEYQDAIAWLNFLNMNFGNDIQIILHGVSMGSATVMMMSGADSLPQNVKFTVADCGYTSAWCQFEHNIEFLGKAEYALLYGADFFNKLISGYHFKDADPLSAVKKAKVPMLFVHGTADDFVPTFMGKELYDACTAEYKDILLVEGAGHAQSYMVDSDAYNMKLDEFTTKYIK